MTDLFGGVYKNKTVLITGHTGFKGSWLTYWLTSMGARVIGYSHSDEISEPNHYSLLPKDHISIIGDIRDREKIEKTVRENKPDIVFHLAAQPLVRYSYEHPAETYETNVMGTLYLYEAVRKEKAVKVVINITSDKSYENKEWVWGYRETDPMGGYDPYSSSKGASEILTSSYRNSFFNLNEYGTGHNMLLASARAGNVIGGGDWAADRLIVDIVKAATAGNSVYLRYPHATRPWQHVLEPLSGYLLLGQKLLEGDKEFADSWNFGPSDENNKSVIEVAVDLKKIWSDISFHTDPNFNEKHEAGLLKLDCSKALTYLSWKPVWPFEETIQHTIEWYRQYYGNNHVSTVADIESYINDAKKKGLIWAKI